MKIAFIGGGNMGEAIISALLKNKIATIQDITVSDTSEARRRYLADKYCVNVVSENVSAINGAGIIILAIKPQILPAVISDLKGSIQPEQLVISIVAGARIASIRNGLSHSVIVRSMPNTPAQIGEGMTVWTATTEVSSVQKKHAQRILEVMGKQIYTQNEKDIDMATAVSGSGPAYLFYFVEALTESAIELGFTPDDARTLAIQTVTGAIHLLQQSGKDARELRQAVTSPGGTTAAAIKELENGDFKKLLLKAVESAHKRAIELGQ